MADYEQRYCVFLDVLGFKDQIFESAKDGATAAEKRRALGELADVFGTFRPWASPTSNPDVQTTQFSDSLVVSFRDTESPQLRGGYLQVISSLHGHLLALMHLGFLVRGGLTYGALIHHTPIVYGPALVEAVELEKKAVFPRLILTPIVAARMQVAQEDEVVHYLRLMVRNEQDGLTSFDYLEIGRLRGGLCPVAWGRPQVEYCEQLDALISVGLQHPCEKVRKKYVWLACGLHETAGGFASQGFPDDALMRKMLGQYLTKYAAFERPL